MTDHIIHHRECWEYAYPPQFTPEDIETFGDGLRETILEKVGELMERAEELKKDKEAKLDIIAKVNRKERLKEFDIWFWTFWTETQFSEYYVIQKWLRYWLDLDRMITKKPSRLADKFAEKGVTREELSEAKRYPLERLYHGELQHATNRLMGKCPFHKENTPSFVIYEDENTFNCFGCGVWGDPVDYVMKTENLSLVEAVRKLI